jgi:CheY-like chemotaxis protein/HPt (histidine-containing phosphotransfer) domain-containing protein/anti-sigma regulatory factor (Ser/Thr protein kinase)
MHPLAADKGLTFEIREKGDLPANIVTDATHLQQCLTNLVNNAVKFTEQGHIYVNISLEDKDDKPCIRFEVEDTGIGIAAESQQKIFEPFVQEDGSTSRKYSGTGLGLTIARKFAGLLGGELTLTSEKGKGSVFSLIIPAGIDLAAQPLLERQKISDDTSTDMSEAKHARFSGCVLVAEDVKSNQMFMKFLLERMGLKVTIAENGAEAVNKALGQKFDLIFMDIQMPKVNGYEAARTLRSKGIKIPIVALTAGTMGSDEEKCIEAGCDVYLSKPVVLSKLIETLSKYLPSENPVLIETVNSVKSQADELTNLCLNQTPLEHGSKGIDDIEVSEDIINWEQLINMWGGEELIKEVTAIFLKDSKERLAKLSEAVKAGDSKEIKFYAHAIKGSAKNTGAKRLSDIANQLECVGRENDIKTATTIFDKLKTEFEKVATFLSRPDWIEIARQEKVITDDKLKPLLVEDARGEQ